MLTPIPRMTMGASSRSAGTASGASPRTEAPSGASGVTSSLRTPATLRVPAQPGTASTAAGSSGRATTSLGHLVPTRQGRSSTRGARASRTAKPPSRGSQLRHSAGTRGRSTTETRRAPPSSGVTQARPDRPLPAVCLSARSADRCGQDLRSGPMRAARRSSWVEPVTGTVSRREKGLPSRLMVRAYRPV